MTLTVSSPLTKNIVQNISTTPTITATTRNSSPITKTTSISTSTIDAFNTNISQSPTSSVIDDSTEFVHCGCWKYQDEGATLLKTKVTSPDECALYSRDGGKVEFDFFGIFNFRRCFGLSGGTVYKKAGPGSHCDGGLGWDGEGDVYKFGAGSCETSTIPATTTKEITHETAAITEDTISQSQHSPTSTKTVTSSKEQTMVSSELFNQPQTETTLTKMSILAPTSKFHELTSTKLPNSTNSNTENSTYTWFTAYANSSINSTKILATSTDSEENQNQTLSISTNNWSQITTTDDSLSISVTDLSTKLLDEQTSTLNPAQGIPYKSIFHFSDETFHIKES